MTLSSAIGFEADILDQADALATFAGHRFPAGIAALDFASFDRIILTGMGSSDYVTLGLELALGRRGLPVWRVQTSHLLHMPQLITPRTLLWITSQSGSSGEVVALLDHLRREARGTVVGVTNDPESPLGRAADHLLLLHSGTEATVSSKSYLNTLAALHRVAAHLEGQGDSAAMADILELSGAVRLAAAEAPAVIETVAARALAGPRPRFALIGSGSDAATALTGALILKEAAKVAAEGYVGGAFRHGPLELAGPGLTAILFGEDARDVTLRNLAIELTASGSTVLFVGPQPIEDALHVAVPAGPDFARLALGMIALQHLSVRLARAGGFVPGAFRYGKKITAQL